MSAEERDDAEDCGCAFRKAGPGARRQEDGGPYDHARIVADCTYRCKDEFLGRIYPDYRSNYSGACAALSSPGVSKIFWELYRCDSTNCGVWTDPKGGLGQDPGVDDIIGRCQGKGFTAIIDPGPPPADYTCNAAATKESRLPCGLVMPSSTLASAPAAGSSQGISATVPTKTEAPPSSTVTGGAVLGNATDAVDYSATSSPGHELSTGVKAVIGLGSAMGALVLASLGFVVYYRRRKRKRQQHRALKAHIRHHHGFSDQTEAPTPLISPANSATGGVSPLTPPARLRDRKLLPSLFKPGGRSASPPLTSLSPPRSPAHARHARDFAFPSSPNCSPTTTKLLPRHERSAKVYAIPVPPTGLRSPVSAPPAAPGTSLAAEGSAPARSSLPGEAIPRHAPAAPAPASPTRPPRPHETPLEIPDLVSPASSTAASVASAAGPGPVSPAGPPPNRALPAPPTSPGAAARPDGAPDEARDEVRNPPAPKCECAAGRRESWGSWTTGPGGRKARLGSGESERTSSGLAPLLREEDMESLGGGY